ncbi:MAG: fumarate reductase subunit C [Acidimicrobiales bacterium]
MRSEERQRYPVYVAPTPRFWWLRTAPFRRFVLRELTSVFVGLFSVVLLLFLLALSRGEEAYNGFLNWLDLPGIMILHAVTLAAVLYHTATSIQLASQIQEVRLGGRTVPRPLLMAGMTGALIVASAVVAYLHVWF